MEPRIWERGFREGASMPLEQALDLALNELHQVVPGNEAEFTVNTSPGRIFKAKVDSIVWAQGQGQPKPEMEQRAIQALKSDPQMRQAFFNKVSAPIVNKMFECGMIP